MEDKLRWNFNVFLLQIAKELGEGDLLQMKFVLKGNVTSAKCDEMDALQYVTELQRLLLLTPTKLGIFKDTLRVIGRPDLVEKIEENEAAFATLPGENLEQKEYDAVCDGIEKAAAARKFKSLPRADLSASKCYSTFSPSPSSAKEPTEDIYISSSFPQGTIVEDDEGLAEETPMKKPGESEPSESSSAKEPLEDFYISSDPPKGMISPDDDSPAGDASMEEPGEIETLLINLASTHHHEASHGPYGGARPKEHMSGLGFSLANTKQNEKESSKMPTKDECAYPTWPFASDPMKDTEGTEPSQKKDSEDSEDTFFTAHDYFSSGTVPLDILTRGPLALKAYKEALARGETSVRRVPLMLIGQGGAGKTSTKKSLKGICFDPNEDRTVGIDVDPSHFKVSTETWRSGEQGQDQNSDTAIYLDYHLARCIADSLKTQENTIQRNTDTNFVDFEITEMPGQPITTEESSEGEDIKTPSTVPKEEAAVDERFPRGDLNDNRKELFQESHGLSLSTVPEEVAAVTERFLRGDVDDNREDIYFTFWDFAGQSVYYVTHPLFLTARAMFLLVYDLSLNPYDEAKPVLKQGVYEESEESYNIKTNVDYLDFWMRSVASLARGQAEGSRQEETTSVKLPPVFLVCTHADKPYGHGDPEKLARKIFGYLKRKPYGAHLCDVFWIDNTSLRVNNSDCPQVVRLREEIIAVAKELPFINETIPINWLKFEKALQAKKEVGNKRISLESAKDIAKKDCNIVDEKEFETLLNYLHDIRSLIHYEDTVQLNKLVVLDPQWLVDVFKKVITVKPYDPKEKEFLHLWCKLESTGVLDENLVAHVWSPLFEDQETLESLIGIMERFSLLCPWSVHASNNRQYLVPPMLKSCPTSELLELVESANIPSLFIKFPSVEVPPPFFHRLVVQFIQWGREGFWSEETPQLFMGFARFYTSEEKCSVVFICHSSSVEVVVHGGNSAPSLPSRGEETCARRVCRQLSLILECMRNQFPWLENMTYEMCVICPVCSKGREVAFCQTHGAKICKQEECLHFWTMSELCSDTRNISCRRFAFARDTKVEIRQFFPWFPAQEERLGTDKYDGDPFALGEGNQEKALAVCSSVFEHLSSKSCDAELVVSKLKETLRLDQASLEQPDSDTKKQIRCLARKASRSNRPDVVEYLREITPAGTTGPLLPESLDVRRIPLSQARQLTIDLTVADGDKWKFVAEKLGLNPGEIRFLDERNKNPVDALLAFVANQRYMSVGELYQVLCDCGIPVIADQL